MDRRPLLPSAVVVMLAVALAIYLIEKIGQAVLAISNVVLLVALAWILTRIKGRMTDQRQDLAV